MGKYTRWLAHGKIYVWTLFFGGNHCNQISVYRMRFCLYPEVYGKSFIENVYAHFT